MSMKSRKVKLRPLKPTDTIQIAKAEASSKIYERNDIPGLHNHDFKPIGKIEYDKSIYKQNWEKINDNKPWKKEETAEFRQTATEAAFRRSNFNGPSEKEIDHQEPTHYDNFKTFKQKKFSELASQSYSVPPSKLTTSNQYSTIKGSQVHALVSPVAQPIGSSTGVGEDRTEESDKKNLYRKNFYISKPYDDINKDYKYKPLVRNAATISEETPFWFKGPAKYYTSDYNQQVREFKAAQKRLPKTDIFDQKIEERVKVPDIFFSSPPSKGQVYELAKMNLLEKKKPEVNDGRIDHVKIEWKEDYSKQKYDQIRLNKIGETDKPYYKFLEDKKKDPYQVYKKIGEDPNAIRIKKPKDFEHKIGQPEGERVYRKKRRDDGCFDKLKQITGEKFNTATGFFQP